MQDGPACPSGLSFIPAQRFGFPESPCSIRCPHAQAMKSTKYTARWSVGMCRVKTGNTEARPLSAAGPSKPCFTLEADDWPPECGGSSRRTQLGIKAAISTPFLSWWVEIWAKTNPPSPQQLCPLLSTKESPKDTLNTSNQIYELQREQKHHICADTELQRGPWAKATGRRTELKGARQSIWRVFNVNHEPGLWYFLWSVKISLGSWPVQEDQRGSVSWGGCPRPAFTI